MTDWIRVIRHKKGRPVSVGVKNAKHNSYGDFIRSEEGTCALDCRTVGPAPLVFQAATSDQMIIRPCRGTAVAARPFSVARPSVIIIPYFRLNRSGAFEILNTPRNKMDSSIIRIVVSPSEVHSRQIRILENVILKPPLARYFHDAKCGTSLEPISKEDNVC